MEESSSGSESASESDGEPAPRKVTQVRGHACAVTEGTASCHFFHLES